MAGNVDWPDFAYIIWEDKMLVKYKFGGDDVRAYDVLSETHTPPLKYIAKHNDHEHSSQI